MHGAGEDILRLAMSIGFAFGIVVGAAVLGSIWAYMAGDGPEAPPDYDDRDHRA